MGFVYSEFGDPLGHTVKYFYGTPGSRLEPCRAHEVGLQNGYHILTPDRPGIGASRVPQPPVLAGEVKTSRMGGTQQEGDFLEEIRCNGEG